MSDAWKMFVKTEQGSRLKDFFLRLNHKIGRDSSDRKKQKGVLLLNTRKGYWIYKIFEKEEACDVLPVMVYSDRYVQKMLDLQAFEGKMIYLADDTLIRGNNLLETYELLADKVGEEKICPIVFAMNGRIDIEKKKQSAEGRRKNFWGKLKYYLLMSEDELGELSIKETQLIHREGIPNMIDLPYLEDADRNADALNYQVCLTGDQFEALQKKRKGWEFHFNSYAMENETVLQGFIIQMKDEQLLQNTAEFAHDYVVEGTYLMDENGNARVVFTPFAILKSMNKAFLLKLWNALFDGCKEYVDSKEDVVTNEWIRYYKECVYALSMMVAGSFCREVAAEIGFALNYDYKILKDHFPESMIDRMRDLERIMQREGELFRSRLEKIYGEVNDCTYKGKKLGERQKRKYDEEALFKAIHEIILLKKDALGEQPPTREQRLESILGIEEMERCMNQWFEFETEQEKRFALTRVIVTILRSSICNNKLELDPEGNCLIRGFRYGENSDLVLPFFDLYFYWAVILLVSKYTMEGAACHYKDFAIKLRRAYEELGLLGDDVSKENFKLNDSYYNRVLKGKNYLYNKFCFVQPYLKGRVEGVQAFYMKKMEEFVEEYC